MSILIMLLMGVSMLVQMYLTQTYKKWSQVGNAAGLSGAQAARQMLDEHNLHDVSVHMVPGNLTDHYNPSTRSVHLSEHNYSQPSVAALAVAAHEVGHAIQHKISMPALVIRGKMAVPLSLGMNVAPMLFMAGIVLQMTSLIWVGIGFFAFAFLFHLVTLPVEFDASRRALVYIRERNLAGAQGESGAKTVLTAAALTYIMSFAMALAQLLHMIGLARRSR